jgi:hypothetical protein
MPTSILARSLLAAFHPDLARFALMTVDAPTSGDPAEPSPPAPEGADRPGATGTR